MKTKHGACNDGENKLLKEQMVRVAAILHQPELLQ